MCRQQGEQGRSDEKSEFQNDVNYTHFSAYSVTLDIHLTRNIAQESFLRFGNGKSPPNKAEARHRNVVNDASQEQGRPHTIVIEVCEDNILIPQIF